MRLRSLVAALAVAASLNAVAAAMVRVDLSVPGMDCTTCPITGRRALQAVPGVKAAKIDCPTKTATVEFDPGMVGLERRTKATAHAGCPSAVANPASNR